MACWDAVAVSVRAPEKRDAVAQGVAGRPKAALEDNREVAGRRSWRETDWISTILKDDEIPLNWREKKG